MTVPPHPAKFSEGFIDMFRDILIDYLSVDTMYDCARTRILDPFAGVGTIHQLDEFDTYGVEIEPEWAAAHPRTIVGDATCLPFQDLKFAAVVTSPAYGNRMADHHDDKNKCGQCGGLGNTGYVIDEGKLIRKNCNRCNGAGFNTYKRMTYKHQLGRDLHDNSGAKLQWGQKYKAFHIKAWDEAYRVLKIDGLFILNVSDHIRKGDLVKVCAWHDAFLKEIGLYPIQATPITTKRMGFGENGNVRVDYEMIYVYRKRHK